MMGRMAEHEVRAGESAAHARFPGPVTPLPVSQADFERPKRRRWFWTITGTAVLAALIWFSWNRYTAPDRAVQSFDAGVRLYRINRYNQAILEFDQAIALDPRLTRAYLMRGRSQIALSEIRKALADFEQVVALDPENEAGYVDRAAAELELNDIQATLADSEHALRLNPESDRAHNLKGVCLRSQGHVTEALAEFTRAVSLDANLDNLYQRAATYQQMGRHAEALADLNRAVQIDPANAEAYFARAASKRQTGDASGAEEDHRKGRVLNDR